MAADSTQPTVRQRRPPPSRGRRPLRVLALLTAVAVLLGVGILLGLALGDRPREPARITSVREVRQVTVTETVAERTTTVVVTAPSP